MTLAEIMGRRSLRNEQLALILSCLITAVDHRDRPGASELFNEALAAGRRMVPRPATGCRTDGGFTQPRG